MLKEEMGQGETLLMHRAIDCRTVLRIIIIGEHLQRPLARTELRPINSQSGGIIAGQSILMSGVDFKP